MTTATELIAKPAAQPAIIKIPSYRQKLLFISHSKPRDHGLQITISISEQGGIGINNEVPDDPSTIYSIFLAVDPKNKENVPKLSYFPSYSKMQPEQRGLYLRWLYNVTAPIDIGYIFVYYYGLERHLVYGDFDAAFDEIRLLRQHHDNGSFQSYSASALVHSCLLRKRIDKLQELYASGFDYFDNSNLLILHHSNLDIFPDMMFKLATILTGVNRRYIRSKPDEYKQQIERILMDKFGKLSYPLTSKFTLEGVEGIPYPIFANISFPAEIRTPRLPNLLRNPSFHAEMRAFFGLVHEAVKNVSKGKRKNT
jgi:hypothetical protein